MWSISCTNTRLTIQVLVRHCAIPVNIWVPKETLDYIPGWGCWGQGVIGERFMVSLGLFTIEFRGPPLPFRDRVPEMSQEK